MWGEGLPQSNDQDLRNKRGTTWRKGADVITIIPSFHSQHTGQEDWWQPNPWRLDGGQAMPHDHWHLGIFGHCQFWYHCRTAQEEAELSCVLQTVSGGTDSMVECTTNFGVLLQRSYTGSVWEGDDCKVERSPRAVFLNCRAAARYWALASIIPGPHVMEKRIYRATVWQRSRTTALEVVNCLVELSLKTYHQGGL
jgi:hypothetical protein